MPGDKKADLAGPGISTYPEVEKILPRDYEAVLPPSERMKALFAIKEYVEKNLCPGAVRLQTGRGSLHGHAGGAQGLLPRPRPQCLCRPVGLGAGDVHGPAQPRIPPGRRQKDLEGYPGRRDICPGALPSA